MWKRLDALTISIVKKKSYPILKGVYTMKARLVTLSVLSLLVMVVVILSGCGTATPTPSEAATLDDTPESAVEAFYRWYTSYNGNVMVDEAYRDHASLTPDVVQKVDDIIASFTHGGYDPFLCAQDIPQAFEVDTALVDGDTAASATEATVTAHGVWNPDTAYENRNDIFVKLTKVNGVWKIADISCAR
jgi:hypothetical protein